MQQSLNEGAHYDDLLLESVRVAELHCAAFLFSDNARNFGVSDTNLDPGLAAIMRKMTALWGLHVLFTFGDQGFMEGFFSPKQMKDIEKEYLGVRQSK